MATRADCSEDQRSTNENDEYDDDLTDTEEHKHELWKLGLASTADTLPLTQYLEEVSRLQAYRNKLIDTWISGDTELLERLARHTGRLTFRMSTLKASGLGFLMNTSEMWSQASNTIGNTRELVNSTLKRWRRWCRERQ